MTPAEKLLWDYIDEESDVLLVKVRDQVLQDGFAAAVPVGRAAVETVAIKVLSSAMIKTLAVMCEAVGRYDLMQAYMEMAPMHAELLKSYMLREIGR